MEKIEQFLKVNDGYGDGSGYGYGDGSGYGYGYGDGDGSGYGYGYGYGDGSGDGYGYGYGDGSGDGSGDGDGLKSLNNQKIHLIDNIQSIIKSVRNNVAKGFIVQNDLSLTPCFIAKGENKFAHGETIEEAISQLQIKLLEDLSVEERIERFKSHFNLPAKKYKAIEFYNWHTSLTGSCDLGKKSFVKDKNIDLDKDAFTVKEFISLVENNYGSDVIHKLKNEYNER